MKLNRRDLRRLIESMINEENPGSKFAAAEKKGANKNRKDMQDDMDKIDQAGTKEMQKTYDWYVNTVFPAIEDNDFPIVADDTYYHGFTTGKPLPPGLTDRRLFPIKKGTTINDLNDLAYTRPQGILRDILPEFVADALNIGSLKQYTLKDLYSMLEYTVIANDFRVTMQSEQPDEFETESKSTVKLPSHDEIKALGDRMEKESIAKAGKDQKGGQINESLSRGSLYRRRYYGRY